jgi:hypothetical protein
MATAALVDRDLDIGRKILGALAKASIRVNIAFWAYVPQISEWQLFIATPLVDSKGPRSAYEAVLRVLRDAGMDPELPWRRIFLRSPKDPILKSLENQSIPRGTPSAYYVTYAPEPSGTFRILNVPVGGTFIEDAYLYGATWLVTGLDHLRTLLSKLHVRQDVQDSAIRELSARKRALIPNVRVRVRDFRHLRPA